MNFSYQQEETEIPVSSANHYNQYQAPVAPVSLGDNIPESIIEDTMSGTEFVKVKNYSRKDNYSITSIEGANFAPINTYQEVSTLSVKGNDIFRVVETFAESFFANDVMHDGNRPLDKIAAHGKLYYFILMLSTFARMIGVNAHMETSTDSTNDTQSVTITTQNNHYRQSQDNLSPYVFGDIFDQNYLQDFLEAILKVIDKGTLVTDYIKTMSDYLAIDSTYISTSVQPTDNKLYISYQGNEHILISEEWSGNLNSYKELINSKLK